MRQACAVARRLRLVPAACAVMLAGAASAAAQPAETFFHNKKISFVVGYNPGGSYDAYARLAAQHWPRHIPGQPTIVVQNMQGAGGLNAGNFVVAQGARDGTAIGMIGQATALEQALQNPAIRFDAGALGWIGRITSAVEATVVWHTSPTKTIADAMARETVLAATGGLATSQTNPRLMNALAGTKFKIIAGYPGAAATMLAMEKGEVEGAYAGLASLRATRGDWLRDGKIAVLVQYSQARHRAFPDVPAMVEFGRTDEDRQLLALFGSSADIGITIMAPPDVPGDRLRVLRRAFDAMVADPAFRADAEARQMEVEPMTGEDLQRLIASVLATPPDVVKRAAAARDAK